MLPTPVTYATTPAQSSTLDSAFCASIPTARVTFPNPTVTIAHRSRRARAWLTLLRRPLMQRLLRPLLGAESCKRANAAAPTVHPHRKDGRLRARTIAACYLQSHL